MSHLELFLPEYSILVVSLSFWNDPALMILMIQLSTQEASLKEIENVWTVFQNWKTGFGVHVNIVLKFIWPLIQRCLLVLFRRWREWMWSRRWASVSCTDSALSVLLPDSTPPAEVDTNYTYFSIVMQINFRFSYTCQCFGFCHTNLLCFIVMSGLFKLYCYGSEFHANLIWNNSYLLNPFVFYWYKLNIPYLLALPFSNDSYTLH